MSTGELLELLERLDADFRARSRADESDIEAWLYDIAAWYETPHELRESYPLPSIESAMRAVPLVMAAFYESPYGRPTPDSRVWQLLRAHCAGCCIFRVRHPYYLNVPIFEGMVGVLNHADPYHVACGRLEWGMDFSLIGVPTEDFMTGWAPIHAIEPATYADLMAMMEASPTWPDWTERYGRRPERETAAWRLQFGPDFARRGDSAEARHLASSQLDALEAAFAAVLAWLDEGLPAQEAVAEAAKVLSRALDSVVICPADTELVARYAAVGPGARRARKGAARIASFMRDGREERVQRTLEGLRALREG